MPTPTDFVRLRLFAKRYPDFASETTLRWLYANRDQNGIAEANAIVKRAGGVYINVPALMEFMAGESVAS